MKKKLKRINVEVDFHDFNELRAVLKQLVEQAELGIPYGYESPFGIHVKSKYEYTMQYLGKTKTEERTIDGVIHLITKSRL